MPAKDSPPYSRNDVVASLTTFYQHLTTLHVPASEIAYPPPGGWPTITPEKFAHLGKTPPTAIDLLHHIPYIVEPANHHDQIQIWPGTRAVDYRGPSLQREWGEWGVSRVDPEFPLTECENPKDRPAAHVVVLRNLARGRNGDFLMVDTEKGVATMDDWQVGEGGVVFGQGVLWEVGGGV